MNCADAFFVGGIFATLLFAGVMRVLALLGTGPKSRGHDPEDQHESPPIHKGDYR